MFHYREPIDRLIQELKFSNRLYRARLLGEYLGNHAEQWLREDGHPDKLIPVPLHRNRIRQRGFNQSVELARVASKKLVIPMDLKCVQRIRNTKPQSRLPLKQRKHNIRGAFETVTTVRGRSVVIIDDVITTGNTVNEIARTLKKAGAKSVIVWSVARA